ncbi:hypothetical protein P0Y35_08220 [Kiritimatiellaeota bacterium B1221]|nr:hypothetical protein [Kiritimatiellaeota bacterium B1221]
MTPAASKPKRILFWILLLLCIGWGLQHIPGSYTIDDFEDDYELTSLEGAGLLAISDASLNAECYFEDVTRHRISRNAEILVPAGATLQISASTSPYVEQDEVILKPATLLIKSDKPLTFIYRFVTVAKANTLEIHPDDPEHKVKAVGQYKVLSALATAYRYKRQKEVRRDYKIPTKATLDFHAHFYPDHEIKTHREISLITGSEPGHFLLTNAKWEKDTWQSGELNISVPFSDLEPSINQLLKAEFPDEVEVGGALDLRVEKIHHLKFTQNFLDLYVEGRITYAGSRRISKIFNPSFKTHLGITFDFPEKTLLQEARLAVSLSNIYSLDFNRSNPIFDKMARKILRSKRDDASVYLDVKKSLPEISQLPGDVYVETLNITGDANGYPTLELKTRFTPKTSSHPSTSGTQ